MFDDELKQLKKMSTKEQFKEFSKPGKEWRKQYDMSVDKWAAEQAQHRTSILKGMSKPSLNKYYAEKREMLK